MERFNPTNGEQTDALAEEPNDLADHPLSDANLLPLGEQPISAIGILPVAGTLGAATAGGLGVTQGTTGPLLPGASLYPVVAPLTEYEGADQSLADRAEAALAEDGRLSADVVQMLHIAVEYGTILLTGTAPSATEREIAERICAHVPGARKVENRVIVAAT